MAIKWSYATQMWGKSAQIAFSSFIFVVEIIPHAMNDKKPETLTIEQIRDRLSETVDERQLPILADGVALLSRGRNLFGKAVEVQIPYRLPGVRLGVLMAGEADVMINLMSYHVEAPAAVFIGDNSIFQLQSIAPGSEVQGVFVDPALFGEIFSACPPATFNGQVRDFITPINQAAGEKINALIQALTLTFAEGEYNRSAVHHLIAALAHVFSEIYEKQVGKQQSRRSHTRQLFDRFILLVNKYGSYQHNLAFYAAQLCISQPYLSRVVQQESGVYAKEWIDRAVITEAKVMLKHSNLPIARIAEKLNFSNPSFFNKYFKRLAGVTPSAFRNS